MKPMRVTLLNITPNAEEFIGNLSSICYSSRKDRESSIKRAIKCVESGHLATLRFAHATFHVSGISRICSHQFVRSKHLDFLQRSQRYVKEDSAHFAYPGTKEDYLISCAYQHAYNTYHELIKRGVKKEDARFVLPNGFMTELNVTGNLQAWLDFLRLRTDKAAQQEIRKVATEIGYLLAEQCPNIFKEFAKDAEQQP
jgi:thymidylate synthase (FAD)